MEISLNWLRDYVDIPLSVEEISVLLTDIGLEVEGIEDYVSIKGGLEGLVVGFVQEKEKHPDADKLSVCKVDIGTEVLQIVCGAPNVAAGQKVIVALVGTQIFPTKGEPFTIKKAKIRGIESVGMICAEDEIGIGESHDGIMVLDENTKIGSPASSLFNVYKDVIIEIGLTPNRSDAHSHLGVARDLLAAYNYRNNENIKLKAIETYQTSEKIEKNFKVSVEDKVDCPKYLGILLGNISVQESPFWLQNKLRAIGQKPINHIVDVTNFVMHELGQPLHAFDVDAITGNEIIVKKVDKNTPFVTLDGSEIKLSGTELMICNAQEPMCIAGVYGGKKSGVTENTKSIFLESAYFNPKSIRATSTKYQLKTDAAIHFEKGIDPNITQIALERAVFLLQQIDSNVTLFSNIYNIKNQQFNNFEVKLNFNKVRQLTGASISNEQILKILNLLEIKVQNLTEQGADLFVPPYRADVQREVDVIEDILRIYGFNNILIPLKINASVNISETKNPEQIYEQVANDLASIGYAEILTNPLSKSKLIEKFEPAKEKWVNLLSSINVELDVLRNNMLFSVLETVSYNNNHKNSNLRLFELGRTYHKSGQDYIEHEHLILCHFGLKQEPNWKASAQKSDFFTLKTNVNRLLQKLGISQYELSFSESNYFEYGLEYISSDTILVKFGKVSNNWTTLFDIKQEVYYAEFNWLKIIELYINNKVSYKPVSKFPSVKRDLALLLSNEIKFGELKATAEKIGKKLLQKIDIFDIYTDDKMKANEQSYALSFLFKDEQKTLQDTDIDAIMQKMIQVFQKEFNATIR